MKRSTERKYVLLLRAVGPLKLSNGRTGKAIVPVGDPNNTDFLDARKEIIGAYLERDKSRRKYPELDDAFFLALESGLVPEVEVEVRIK